MAVTSLQSHISTNENTRCLQRCENVPNYLEMSGTVYIFSVFYHLPRRHYKKLINKSNVWVIRAILIKSYVFLIPDVLSLWNKVLQHIFLILLLIFSFFSTPFLFSTLSLFLFFIHLISFSETHFSLRLSFTSLLFLYVTLCSIFLLLRPTTPWVNF